MFEHADRRDGVELLAAQVAVVLQADLDLVGQPGQLHPAPGLVDLLAAEGDPDHGGPVTAGGMDGHRAPAAAHIEQPGSGALIETELATDQFVLGRLRLLEGGAVGFEPGARIGHARAEDEPIEVVAHVVVVADHRGIPGRRVEPARRSAFLGRRGERRSEGPQPPGGVDDGGEGPQSHPPEIAG